ncbi:hypothetical protein DSL92_08230 [Billgrantia gudaonensis]|uniref:Uncharacterized protein n=1 Tax=Billgrantia gudaonensis TaxID=376427 RepID=A0A3S0NDL1_9GAMM|nr:hypothetical protein DSL92_08230 [Halomonas gudaonensis]
MLTNHYATLPIGATWSRLRDAAVGNYLPDFRRHEPTRPVQPLATSRRGADALERQAPLTSGPAPGGLGERRRPGWDP